MAMSNTTDTECCGAHLVCEREWRETKPEIVYYDDEELDVCARRNPETYTEQEVERFEYVIDTMRESDVPGWVHSLQQREIELPTVVRDRVIMMLQ